MEPAPTPKIVLPPSKDDAATIAAVARAATPAHPAHHRSGAPVEKEQNMNEAIHVAISLAQGGDVDEAAAVIHNECGDASGAGLGAAYTAMIDAKLRANDLDGAFNVLAQVRNLGSKQCVVSTASYEAVLRAAVQ